MLEKLLGIGFTTHICTTSIDGTVDRMFQQMESNADLDAAVFRVIRDDSVPVTKDNYDEILFDWVTEEAEALHAERMHDLISPFTPPKRKCASCRRTFTQHNTAWKKCVVCAWI